MVGQWATYYNIYYQSHVEVFGDSRIYKNGEFCGTTVIYWLIIIDVLLIYSSRFHAPRWWVLKVILMAYRSSCYYR
jgi:hypothetical protein